MHDAIVIGAGPAGLATSRELMRRRIDHVVFEAGDCIGYTWANLYDGLVLHTGKHLSALPGMPFPSSVPLFPPRQAFLDYLNRYARAFRLPVQVSARVVNVARSSSGWRVRTAAGKESRSRALVLATGIVSNPYVPSLSGADRFRGRIAHSVEYRRPQGFEGQRVLIVGAGNSAGEISVELAAAGAYVTVAVRSGARVVPRELFGVPIQYLAASLNFLPRAAQRLITVGVARTSEMIRGRPVLPPPPDTNCPDVPLIGFQFADAVRAGRIQVTGGIRELTTSGAVFADGREAAFDRVLLATGYKAAVGALGDLVRLDECGFAARRRRVVSVDQPDLYFVGHNYDVRGGLRNIALDARRAARLIGRGSANSQRQQNR